MRAASTGNWSATAISRRRSPNGEIPQNPAQTTPAKEPKDLVHWSLEQEHGGIGSMELDTATPLNTAVPASLKLTVSRASGEGKVGVANDGFWGHPREACEVIQSDVLREGRPRVHGRRHRIHCQ